MLFILSNFLFLISLFLDQKLQDQIEFQKHCRLTINFNYFSTKDFIIIFLESYYLKSKAIDYYLGILSTHSLSLVNYYLNHYLNNNFTNFQLYDYLFIVIFIY